MNRVSTLDAGFLDAEDTDARVSQALGALVTLDGPMPGFDALLSTFARRIAVCPRFAQRLRAHPFDLAGPEWVDDSRFELSHHVRRIGLPKPGDDVELSNLVAEVMSWRLDRSRPLWEIWVIEGRADGGWALLLKVHQCIADGRTATHILTGLADRPIGACPTGPWTRPARRAATTAAQWPVALRRTTTHNTTAAARTARGMATFAAGLLLGSSAARRTGPTTTRRRYAAARVRLADIRQVCQRLDVTVDGVASTALTEAVRDYLTRHGEQLQPDVLRSLAPSAAAAGPADRLQIMGRAVTALLPIPSIAVHRRTAVAIVSYADHLYFGVLADFDAVSDLDELTRGIEAAVARLATTSKRRRPRRDRHGLSLVVSA